jgi:hypothetical protein
MRGRHSFNRKDPSMNLETEIAHRQDSIANCDLALVTCAAHPEALLTINMYRDRWLADLAALTMQRENIARAAEKQLNDILASQ